jgi:hypothetical protein
MKASDGGKGSKRRPQNIPNERFWENFGRIFGETDAREQRTDDAGVPHCGDDVRTETNGSDVQLTRNFGG